MPLIVLKHSALPKSIHSHLVFPNFFFSISHFLLYIFNNNFQCLDPDIGFPFYSYCLAFPVSLLLPASNLTQILPKLFSGQHSLRKQADFKHYQKTTYF